MANQDKRTLQMKQSYMVDLTDFDQSFKTTIADFDKVRAAVAKGINEGEKAQKEFEEDEKSWM